MSSQYPGIPPSLLSADAEGIHPSVPIIFAPLVIGNSDSTVLSRTDSLVRYTRTDAQAITVNAVANSGPGQSLVIDNASADDVQLTAAAPGSFLDGSAGVSDELTLASKETIVLCVLGATWTVIGRYSGSPFSALQQAALDNKVSKDDPTFSGDALFKTGNLFSIADFTNSEMWFRVDLGGVYPLKPLAENVRVIGNSDSTTLAQTDTLIQYGRADSQAVVMPNATDCNPGQKMVFINTTASAVSIGAVASAQFFDSTSGVVNAITMAAKSAIIFEMFQSTWTVVARYSGPVTPPAIGRTISVAYAATVTPNANTTDSLLIGALTGNLTLANPSGSPVDFQALRIRVKQDGTGGRTVTLGNKYRIPSSATNPLAWSTVAAATDLFAAMYNAADDKWDVVTFVPGY